MSGKEKSISKTACFGYAGRPGSCLLYWVSNKTTEYNLSLKLEQKKIRMVANADLISFVKQTYLYEWLIGILDDNVKCKINSLLKKTDRIRNLTRMGMTFAGEKWCVPVDLKNFHEHFGKSQLKDFCKILEIIIKDSVKDDEIHSNLLHIVKNLKMDFDDGILKFIHISKDKNIFNDFKKSKLIQNLSKKKRVYENNNTITYCYQIDMNVKNGLMSGWKMTSILGSLFNLCLNRICQRWALLFSGNLNSDINILGDDTHLKCRYLTHALDQIDFINLLRKEAHPGKQMISSVNTEFLKKTINSIDGTVL
jgi:hypothetical protein